MNAIAADFLLDIDQADARDGRNRSRMAAETRRIDILLAEWWRWGKGALAHLNYPSETLDSRVARLGFLGAAQGSPLPEWPWRVVMTEKAVLSLQQIDRTVIIEHYSHPSYPIETQARRRNMSAERFRKLLERARKRVRSRLLELVPNIDVALSHTFG
jgi:hypothetical protein